MAPIYGYGAINELATFVNSNWTALEFSARHPVGHNLFLSLDYTWSHGLSDSTTTNYYNPKEYYGNTTLNLPQMFTVSAVYSVPWLLNAQGWKGTHWADGSCPTSRQPARDIPYARLERSEPGIGRAAKR